MEKIDAYLSKQWNRWFAAKIIIFFSKIAGTFMFLYALGMGGYYENGGNLTAGETIGVIACVILLVIIVTFGERVDNYRKHCARKYKRAFWAKRKMLDTQDETC